MFRLVMETVTHSRVVFVFDVSKHQNGHGQSQSQDPDHHKCPDYSLALAEGGEMLRPHHSHQPVQAHQGDQEDGGVHVGAAEVIQDLAHGYAEDPGPLDEVDDEERREHHEHAICTGQVEDKRGGDRVASRPCNDAPDGEEVAGNADEEGDGEDQSSYDGSFPAAHYIRG